jgi:hypothetical protein
MVLLHHRPVLSRTHTALAAHHRAITAAHHRATAPHWAKTAPRTGDGDRRETQTGNDGDRQQILAQYFHG